MTWRIGPTTMYLDDLSPHNQQEWRLVVWAFGKCWYWRW